jgi:hypothetical protein
MTRLLIIFLLLVISGLQYQKANRLQAAEMGYIKIMHDRREEINLLCRVNRNLTGILRVEIPKMKGDWEDNMSYICK